MRQTFALLACAIPLLLVSPAQAADKAMDKAADKIKIGMATTLSGPTAQLGIDTRDGFNLAIKHLGGKLGGLPVDLQVTDDQFNPEVAKQIIDRFVKRDRVDVATGMINSAALLATAPMLFSNRTPYISTNAGPSQLAGKECSPWFVSTSWQNDNVHEAAGHHANQRNYKNAYLLAPDYPAGRDVLNGFKRTYKGQIASEAYVKLGQLDYAAEIAQLRAAKPEMAFVFLPGGMGINFVKQFFASGLSKDIQLLLPGTSSDQDILPAVGDAMLGLFNTSQWALDLDNPENKRFVGDFDREFKRLPSAFAAQAYDAALRIDAAVLAVKGNLANREAFMKAIHTVKAKSVRGEYKVNVNGYPIQNYYLRVVSRGPDGRLFNKSLGVVLKDHADAYAKDCPLKY